MIVLLWFVNLAISWFNAWSVGTTWDSAKAKGGAAYFMNWMGAIMSASGFTWCYLVVLGLLGSVTPMSWFVEAEPGVEVVGTLLDQAALQAFADLGYLVIILPILGSGLAITVQTWRHFARKRHRTAGDYAITGWNTFAQVHNTYSAMRHIPGALDGVGSYFGGGSSSSSDGNNRGLIVIILVVLAVLGGCLTTFSIVQARRRAVVLEDYRRTVLAEAA
jgi:hypothetical protein